MTNQSSSLRPRYGGYHAGGNCGNDYYCGKETGFVEEKEAKFSPGIALNDASVRSLGRLD
jgi:hypothetical protein